VNVQSVRIYSPFFPYPVREGAYHVAFDQIRTLVDMGKKVELVVWKESDRTIQDKKSQSYLEPFPSEVRLVNLHPSARARSASEDSQMRLKRVTRSMFSPFASPELFYYPPEYSPLSTSNLPAELQEPVDLAIYHYSFAYSWLSREQPVREKKRAVVFLNLESDLFSERERRTSSSLSPAKLIHSLNARKLYQHEKDLARLADELWFISPRDLETYQGRYAASNARLVPPTYSPNLVQHRCSMFERNRAHAAGLPVAGFVGGLDFHPNQISAEWILREVAPRLAEKGFRGEIWIAGKSPSEFMLAAARKYPFVKIMGFVPDLEPFWANLSYALVPHLAGSGVRTKLLEALASGVPTLATSEAALRIHPDLRGSPLLTVSDDPEHWAQKLMTSQPFEDRIDAPAAVLAAGRALDGREIYRFLSDSA
jgi:glycosyltransferase involved in cell wall biosynthesis